MKRKLLSVLLVLGMTLSLAACGNNDEGNETETETEDGNDAGESETEDEGTAAGEAVDFSACIASEPETIDPSLNSSLDGATYIQHTFEGLMKFATTEEVGVEPEIVPGQAAAEPTVSEDGLVYTFQLRDDIFWSDGEPVTANDFVYSWRRIVDPATASDYSYILAMVVNASEIEKGEMAPTELGIKAVDEKTVEITLVTPTPYFLELCTFSCLVPLREDVVQGNDSWTFDNYIGNGKYKITAWEHDNFIEMDKNDQYYAPDEVKTNSIRWVLKDDVNAILADYKSGTVDFIKQFPTDELPSLLDDGTVKTAPQLATYAAVFNVEVEAFKDPRVRKAFSLAIDRNYICEQITQAGELPANAWVPPGEPNGDSGDFNEAKGGYYSIDPADYEKNCEEAKALLADAGFPDGEGFPVVNYLYNTDDRHQKIYEALAFMWQDVLGVTVTGSNQDWNVFLETRTTGDFEVCRHGWVADISDPINFLDMWTTGNGNNYAQFKSEEYDQLIADSFKEVDVNKRTEILHKAEDIILDQEAILAPIFFYKDPYALNPELKGASYTQLGYWHFWNIEKN